MKRSHVFALFLALVSGSQAAGTNFHLPRSLAPVPLTTEEIRRLTAELRTNHPALQALQARTRSASWATNSVRTWEDPMFTFGGVVASDRGPRLGEEGDLIYGLAQKLPLFGKAAAARHAAEAEVSMRGALSAAQFQVLSRDLAKALFQSAYAEHVVAVGDQDLAWLQTMEETTEQHHRAGTATLVELIRIRNERARRASMLQTDRLHRDHALLSINRLLNHPLNAPVPVYELPPLAAPLDYTPTLEVLAARNEPRIRVLRSEIRSAQAGVAVTRRSRYPDIFAGIEGRQYTGDGGFREGQFTVSMSLPWFNRGKYRSDILRDQTRVEAAELEAVDQELTVREAVHSLFVAIDTARREGLLYENEILPRSRQALESAHANWLANRGPFNDIMESRRMMLEAQLLAAKAVAEQHQAIRELLLTCGLDDPAALDNLTRTTASPETKP